MKRNPQSATPVKEVLKDLDIANGHCFEDAAPIPASAKHSLDFCQHEIDAIFSKEWICIGRADELPDPGDYLTQDIAGVSVIIVKQRSGEIAGFINACAHRQACLLDNSSGHAKKITCRYHAWSYDLQGKLISAPYMEMKENFDPSKHALQSIPTEIWEGFIYATLSQNPQTNLKKSLLPFKQKVVGRYGMNCYQTVFRRTMKWHSNWKNLIENFTESYHVPMVHGDTFAKHEKPLQAYVCGEDSDYYGYHYAPQKSDSGLGAAHANNSRLEGEWRRTMVDFCIFPCHLVTLMPDYLWWISVQPRDVDQLTAQWGVALPPEVLTDIPENDYQRWIRDFETYMDVANEEDKEIVEALQIGTASPTLPQGSLHPLERNLWQFNQYLAKKCILR
ncbi:MAG: Rieske 2Fe-2S domain-containing protein [Acidiferrobacterales bacterium]|nr:Rieske 2Fe-2S domain-containing protein [Acidiferrobacterales bacterium]